MWAEYAEVCDYVPLADVPGARELFTEFEPMRVDEPQPEMSP
jgi:hypothetical protein